MKKYDVLVVGGGHAGCEAALAAARMGVETAMFTLSLDKIGAMSCNPSIGGPAKGHLVKEIDSLGGEIGRNSDKSFIQMRMLNTRKGPAVRALRAQSDKFIYHKEMKKIVENQKHLSVIQGNVIDLIVENNTIKGLITKEGIKYYAKTVILATGTFMRGKIYIGQKTFEGGRMGELPSVELPQSLERLGIEMGRFRTGTPPRVNSNSVDFTKLIEQPGDKELLKFSSRTKDEEIKDKVQLSCYLSYTNREIHEEVKLNIDKASTYNGTIPHNGPRYCPSIETKVMRFEEREHHQVFLEPEGYDTNEIYLNGLTTSLPADMQQSILNKVPGLENAEIMRHGYIVEYDYIKATEMKYNLESKRIENLFFAGQINGTTGYEEAAALGLMAGINAVMKVRDEKPFILTRESSYIGLMIDDIITKGVIEPYRVLTARSEHRLLLRYDNADIRLSTLGYNIGLLPKEEYEKVLKKIEISREIRTYLENNYVSLHNPKVKEVLDSKGEALKSGANLISLLKRPNISYEDIKYIANFEDLDREIEKYIETEIKYEGYIKIQQDMLSRQRKLEFKEIPKDFDFYQIQNLSMEAKENLKKVEPINIGQASRISGVNPSDIQFLIHYLERSKNDKKNS